MNPGGKPEPDETPAQTAVRELAEELGLQLAPEELSWLGSWQVAAANEPETELQANVFELTEPILELPTPQAELAEVRWLDLTNPEPRLVLAPLLAGPIRDLLLALPQ